MPIDATLPYDPSNVFARILQNELPASVVYEDGWALAFKDLNPQAPTHVLVVPRRHVANAGELADASPDELADVVRLAGRVAAQEGLAEGHRLVFNTGAAAGQTVFHAHLHVLGGRDLGWPPG